ncbi:SIS domain-containing protein, partial [Mycobacterium tuberculosis]|nr:SIS domain-containing protein [Mycobacterium tuberculosis]
ILTTRTADLRSHAGQVALPGGKIDDTDADPIAAALREVPARAAEVLRHDDRIQALAATIAESRDALYLGRGTAYPIALEGALKLKEISYIHAEGYAAGEMKHGPISLIDDGVPVIALAPSDALFEKVLSNVQEVAARSGRVLLV